MIKEERTEDVICEKLVRLGEPDRYLAPVRLVITNAFESREILVVCSEPSEKFSAALISISPAYILAGSDVAFRKKSEK